MLLTNFIQLVETFQRSDRNLANEKKTFCTILETPETGITNSIADAASAEFLKDTKIRARDIQYCNQSRTFSSSAFLEKKLLLVLLEKRTYNTKYLFRERITRIRGFFKEFENRILSAV